MKGIIMAGGSGTRLYPMTEVVNKQLLAVYDKPMVYYPLCTLMLSGIRDILIICAPGDLAAYQQLMGNGSRFGIHIQYCVQHKPCGIADAFILGADYIADDSVCLILGDNIFYGQDLAGSIQMAMHDNPGATVFAYYVRDPSRYGVISFNQSGVPTAITEKPKKPQSHYAVTGLYIYDSSVVAHARALTPSYRGELEITDLNQRYLARNRLAVKIFGRGMAWLDTGTPSSLLHAAQYVETLEARQGLKIGCPEEVAWRCGYIDDDALECLAHRVAKSEYGQYLASLLSRETRIGELV